MFGGCIEQEAVIGESDGLKRAAEREIRDGVHDDAFGIITHISWRRPLGVLPLKGDLIWFEERKDHVSNVGENERLSGSESCVRTMGNCTAFSSMSCFVECAVDVVLAFAKREGGVSFAFCEFAVIAVDV